MEYETLLVKITTVDSRDDIDNMIVCCQYGMDGRKGAGWWQCTANHGSSVTASITITILESYTFTSLIITLKHNMEHAMHADR